MPEISETLKGSFTKFFGIVRQKIFDGNLWYPQLCKKFFDTPKFLKHWRDAHEIFRHCETKNFRRKLVIPPIMHKIFRYPKFWDTLKGCLRNFSALWDKKISTENRDMPPLIHNFFFDTRNFPENRRVHLQSFSFRSCETKSSDKAVMPPPLLCMKIFDKNFFWNTKVFSNEMFRYSETKTSTENRDTPPPPCPNFFDTRNYCNSKGFPYGNFRYCETKNFQRKILILPHLPLIQTFSVPEINETLKDSPPTENFGTVRQKMFDKKS